MLLTTNKTFTRNPFITFVQYANCSNASIVSFDNDLSLAVSMSIQLTCHLTSFFLSVMALMVVKYYGIAGYRMNRILLLLSVIELVYNGSSSIYYFIFIFYKSYSTINIYFRVFFNLLCHRFLILFRNWWIAFIATARFIVVRYSVEGCRIRVAMSNASYIIIILVGIVYTVVFTLWFSIYVLVCDDYHKFSVFVWNIHKESVTYQIADALTVLMETIMPIVVVIICSILTFQYVNSQKTVGKRRPRRNTKTAKTLLLISIIFTVCQLPSSMMIAFCFVEKESMLQMYPNFENFSKQIKAVALLFSALNSIGNVAIYFARSPDFQSAIHDIYHCRWSFVKFRNARKTSKLQSPWYSYRKNHCLSNELCLQENQM